MNNKLKRLNNGILFLVLGALLLLCNLNLLQAGGGVLVIGIFSLVASVYYLFFGLIDTLGGDKLSGGAKKAFDVLNICMFAAFIFVSCLIYVIEFNQNITGWIINIFGMVAAIGLIVVYIACKLVGGKLDKITQLFGGLFALSLILGTVLDATGAPVALGDIGLIQLVIYATFIFVMFRMLNIAQSE